MDVVNFNFAIANERSSVFYVFSGQQNKRVSVNRVVDSACRFICLVVISLKTTFFINFAAVSLIHYYSVSDCDRASCGKSFHY